MDEFYLPYHFVPVAKGGRKADIAVAELQKKGGQIANVRHDRYEERSGTIECVVEAVSPVFVGDEKEDGQEEVPGYRLKEQPALPASSLRGLIASLAEAASNSAARVLGRTVLGQDCYSFRKPMKQPLSAIGMLHEKEGGWELEPVCLPLLHYNARGLVPDLQKWQTVFPVPVFRVYEGNHDSIRREKADDKDPTKKKWAYRTTSGPMVGIPVKALTWPEVLKPNAVWNRDPSLPLNVKGEKSMRTVVAQKRGAGVATAANCLVRVLGCYEKKADGTALRQIPKEKCHELFLPYKEGRFKSRAVDPVAMERFQQLADQMTKDSEGEGARRPYEPKDTRPAGRPDGRLTPQQGDLVFFDVNDQLRVKEISYSSIWRGRVETLDHKAANAWTFFEQVDAELTPFHKGRKQVTLAERVFGFVEEKDGEEAPDGLRLKGRVRFSPGLADGRVEELPLIPLRELSSPKPPSPALYFRKPKGPTEHIAKSDLKPGTHWPQGRKVYLHHPNAISGNAQPWENPGQFEQKRHVKVRPWAKGSTWRFEIRFDNLNPDELGMLLYALAPANEFRHKIGMGKPLGLGSIQIGVEHVRLVNRAARYSAEGWEKPRFEAEEFNWKTVRDTFREGMNSEIRAAIEELGNPAKLNERTPITYPTVLGPNGDADLYRWFVSNDQQRETSRKLALQPVAVTTGNVTETKIDPLPKLWPLH